MAQSVGNYWERKSFEKTGETNQQFGRKTRGEPNGEKCFGQIFRRGTARSFLETLLSIPNILPSVQQKLNSCPTKSCTKKASDTDSVFVNAEQIYETKR